MNNKNYTQRIDLCLNLKQERIVRDYAKKRGIRLNEAIRFMIEYWEANNEL